MPRPIRLLLIEDNPDDAELVIRQVRAGGYEPVARRVEDAAGLREALRQQEWDVVIADYALPRFDVIAALGVLRHATIDVPFIVVSGTIGEDTAVAMMKAGAHDYVMKDRLARLTPAIEREIAECADRRERRWSQEQLAAAQEQIRWLIQSSPAMIYSARTTDYGVTFVSDNVRAILGCEPEEFYADSTSWIGRIHPDDRPQVLADLPRLLGGGAGHLQYRFRHGDGEYRWVQDEPRTIRDGAGHPLVIVGAVLDVTAKHDLEEQLRQSQKMEAIGRLAGGVAHDFNNLLMVINAYSEQILERVDGNSPLLAGAEAIHKAAQRATTLTRRLLAFSRKQILSPTVLDLNQVVTGVDKLLRHVIGEDLTLVLRCHDDLWRTKADQSQIEQVLMNLAVNARDAMRDGGTISIATGCLHVNESTGQGPPPGDYVTLSVSDTGHGIDPAIRDRIFEPFFTTKAVGEGTGLGLSMVLGIVTQSGGHVTVTSEPGRGTTFTVMLPRVEQAVTAAAAQAQAQAPKGSETVLVVEDQEDVRRLIRETLTRSGYAVREASNGHEALVLWESLTEPIDLLVTDTVMPLIGGPELARRLKPLHEGLKVLFLSGYAEEQVIRDGLAQPGTAFLAKPFSPRTLSATVRELLDSLPRGSASPR